MSRRIHPPLKILACAILVWLVLVFLPQVVVSAEPPDPQAPPGFRLVDASIGVTLYQKNYQDGNPDFVQVIDLSLGAAVKPLHGDITEQRQGKGVFGGDDARFRSKSLQAYWNEAVSSNSSAFCVTNGQFFYMLEYPTRLPFSLKVDGEILTDGYEKKNYPDQKLMLELWPGRADIVPLTQEALYSSTAPDIIAGLTEEANKRARRSVGRTFAAVEDRDQDGNYETVLILNTRTATQEEAAKVLRKFGADKVMMFDGGGSTQLLCQNTSYIYSERLIPQALAVFAGTGQAVPAVALSEAATALPVPTNPTLPAAAAAGIATALPDVVSSSLEPTLSITTTPVITATPQIESKPTQQPLGNENPTPTLSPPNPSEGSSSTKSTTSTEETQPTASPQATLDPETILLDPHALALSAAIVGQPGWSVLVEGESFKGEVQVKNSGQVAWRAGEIKLIVQSELKETRLEQPLASEVAPTLNATFSWTTAPLLKQGIYTAYWVLARGPDQVPPVPAPFHIVVIPKEIAASRAELVEKIDQWTEGPPENIEGQIQEWVAGKSGKTLLDLNSVVWIPASMSPVVALLILGINRMKRKFYQ